MDKQHLEEGTELKLDYVKRDGFLPCVVQDVTDGRILMLGYVNQQALDTTLEKGMATFWSTSRNELWTKGETSGDFLKIVEVLTDCDQDARLLDGARLASTTAHAYQHCKPLFFGEGGMI